MRKIWKPTKPIHFHELGSGIGLVEFEEKRDKERVMRDSPWNFDKCLILFKDFDGQQQIQSLKIVEASFWVRVYDLPMIARNEYMGRAIGNSLGQTKIVDLEE